MRSSPIVLALLLGCGGAPSPAATPTGAKTPAPAPLPATSATPTAKPIALPGAAGALSLDYLAIDRAAGRLWIPAADTGNVDVLDTATGQLSKIEGFATVEREIRGKMRRVGPSAATIGEGVVYVGNRASSEICAIDPQKLARGACVTLPVPPDGVQYVAATKEVWVTTPRDSSLTILDASVPGKLAAKTKIALEGEPEGYAVDEARGLFYTNLEDKDRTVVLDARAHKVTATWEARCGSEGPRGLALDASKQLLFVACTDRVFVVDAAHGGAPIATLDTGAGVDNIDFLDAKRWLYVAAGKAARLTVAHVDEKGALSVVASAPTGEGTRVVVASRDGTAYVADPMKGQILAVPITASRGGPE